MGSFTQSEVNPRDNKEGRMEGREGARREEAGPPTGKNEKPLFLVRDERLIFTDVF